MKPVWVRQLRPKVKELQLLYPMIALKDWASYLLNNQAHFLLGGFALRQSKEYMEMFTRFWTRYEKLDPLHPIFTHHPQNVWGRCVPYLLHGDEGRGKAKVPIMVQSFQMLIGPNGEETTNMSGQLKYQLGKVFVY